MLFVYFSLLVLLFVVGAFQVRVTEATLYWGRLITGEASVEKEVANARNSDDPEAVGYAYGSAIGRRGFQDAITPPIHTKVAIVRKILNIGVYIWGFSLFPWWIAVFVPVPLFALTHMAARCLPQPYSDYFKEMLTDSLSARVHAYKADGNFMKSEAAAYMRDLIQQVQMDM